MPVSAPQLREGDGLQLGTVISIVVDALNNKFLLFKLAGFCVVVDRDLLPLLPFS